MPYEAPLHSELTGLLGGGHTYALHESRVEAVSEQGLRELTEVELQGSCDGIDVHVTQHHQDVFGIYG